MSAALAVVALCLAAPARAAFDDAGFGPRDQAMGGAFTAVGDDPGSMAYNPASLGQASAIEGAAAYSRLYQVPGGLSDRDMTRIAAQFPLHQERLNGAAGVELRYDRRTGFAGDRGFSFAYATRGLRETERTGLDFGASLKLLSSTFEDGGKAGSLKPALDFGALWRFSDRFSTGVSLLNFFSPKFSAGNAQDRAPLALRVGVAEQLRGFVLAADVVNRERSRHLPGRHDFHAGAERWWGLARIGQGALRTGLQLGEGTKAWSWGAGWRSSGARLDYAMIVPLKGGICCGHGVSLSLRFGRADPEAEYERLLTRELHSRRRLTDSLEAGAIKQWKLSEELSRLREETAALKLELERRSAGEADARRRLQGLEQRRRDAAAEYERLKKEREGVALSARETMFREDWRAYEKAKLSGAAESALLEQLNRLLREYKDAGVDLSEANRELLRLQRAR